MRNLTYFGLSEEEGELIRASVTLPMVLSVVQKCRRELENEKSGLNRRLYQVTTDILTVLIREEISRVNRDLKKNQIKVIGPSPADPLGYAFATRGLSNKLAMSRDEARQEIANRLGVFESRLISELGTKAQ